MDISEVREHQAHYLARLKSQKRPYLVTVRGIDIVVWPNVFPPASDTKLFADHIKVNRGDRVFDVTTGAGTLAILAGLQGATGLAADINDEAVRNANENFKNFRVDFRAVKSDLFDNIQKEKFDYIFCNGPYIEGKLTEPLEYSFYGAKDFISRFFKNVGNYVESSGKILFAFAEWGDERHLATTAQANGFSQKLIGERTSSDGERKYQLFEFAKAL